MVRLDNFLTTWKTIRADAAQAVEDMPAERLDYKPQDDMMSFREIAEHILYAGRGLTGLLLDGEANFHTPEFREKLKRYYEPLPKDASPAQIAAGLRAGVDDQFEQLGARDADFLAGLITRLDGMQVTRMEMLQFVKEHELTHRAQLFTYLRLNGVVPPTTRRRLARKK
ncbi:MAG: DinB family protein [Bryobacteraceae bacterium]|nr:DinB family protein [Bryobacteraceae bacterium]